jgi:HEAT repeat protein
MLQKKKLVIPTLKQGGIVIQEILSRRLLASVLLAVGVTFVLVLLELGSLFILNPAHTFVFPYSIFLGLFIFLLEFALIFGGAFLTVKPLALIAYLRTVNRVQEQYNRVYIPLKTIESTRETGDSGQERTSSTDTTQDEHVSLLYLVEQQNEHQVIVGMPGAGKTMALCAYHYLISQKPLSRLSASDKVPVYIPLQNYSLFRERYQSLPSDEAATRGDIPPTMLLIYLMQSDLPGMRYLKSSIVQLYKQGRLLLLCDGLNEVVSDYLPVVSEELVQVMRATSNRCVITCREIDYRRQPDLVQLVEEGRTTCVVIRPLQTDQIAQFVERYIEKQDKQWKHTAGQIISVIERSRLRYHCTNPMLLFMLMGIVDKIGVERGKQVDTRGRLLREYVKQRCNNEQKQAQWSQGAPSQQEVIDYLSEVASAARWANDRSTIQLGTSLPAADVGGKDHDRLSFTGLAKELRLWLEKQPARTAFVDDEGKKSVVYDNASQLLQFAVGAELIEISADNVLSFRHELIAEYFVAEYFFATTPQSDFSIREEILGDAGRWSGPIAIWAGLLDDPLALAEIFAAQGKQRPAYVLPALTLGLVCVGVCWMPPQADIQRTVLLPVSIEEDLSIAVRNKDTREVLARLFTACGQEGGQEIYRALLPLIMVEGIDELFPLLDLKIVPDLLFTQLEDTIDSVPYEAQIKRIARVLGRFDGVVVKRAAQLSLPAPERSPRLRAAVINTLGGTNDASAVEPLIARLRDAEPFIVERAINALIRLGPTLTLAQVLQELEHRAPDALRQRVHQAALFILERFLDEQDVRRRVSLLQYQSILERIVPVLTSNYQVEAEVQLQAREILVKQGQELSAIDVQDAHDNRWNNFIEVLLVYLSSQDDVAVRNVMQVLQDIGAPVVPYLLELLKKPADSVRVRAIEMLEIIRDMRALPALMHILGDKSHVVQVQVIRALRTYVPESIVGLIDCVLHDPSDTVADRASQILVSIGQDVVGAVIEVLPRIVPGRTRFLVQILELIHDPRSLAALISLLETPQLEPLLVVSIIRALGQFSDERVVAPLLEILATTNPQFYEEAVTALSQLGNIALEELIVALDVDHDSAVVQRVRRAILGMSPFPGEQLMRALELSTEAQMVQILTVFRMRGRDGAVVLVGYLQHPDEKLRGAIHQTLEQMPGTMVVPALLAALTQPALRTVVATFLLKYPDAAIVPLINVLGEQERGSIAVDILPQFGARILKPLIVGLADPREVARGFAQRVLVALVHQEQDERRVLQEIVHLFGDPLPERAREALLNVLTNELATVSLPELLEGLGDIRLIDAVAEALVRLVNKPVSQERVLNALIEALFVEDRRSGSEIALVRIGAPAVGRVGELIIDSHPAVAKSAKHILSDIGVPALSFIWTAYSDRNNLPRCEAARAIFHSMLPEVIKDELISLLVSEDRDDVAMAVVLLMERIYEETQMEYQDQVMVPELINYIEEHNVQKTNLRIIAFLLLLGEQAITDHVIQALDDNPQHRQQLTYMLLLLGTNTRTLLLEVFGDPATNPVLRSELAGVLSMLAAPEALTDYVYKLSEYGLASMRAGALFSEQLSLALRTLGGLLVSGQWHPLKLMELRDALDKSDPGYELFNVLLGWRYVPQIDKLQQEMDVQRNMFKKELLALTMKLAEGQQRVSGLETDLEKVRQEHGARGDELQKVQRERDIMRTNLEQLTNEKNKQSVTLEETTRRYNTLLTQYQALQRQLQSPSQGSSPSQSPSQSPLSQSQGPSQSSPRQGTSKINKPRNSIR